MLPFSFFHQVFQPRGEIAGSAIRRERKKKERMAAEGGGVGVGGHFLLLVSKHARRSQAATV